MVFASSASVIADEAAKTFPAGGKSMAGLQILVVIDFRVLVALWCIQELRRGSQVVRPKSAKLLFGGSIPPPASRL